MNPRSRKSVRVSNDLGLHLRAAGILVQMAGGFASEITLERDGTSGQRANAKSIMSVLALAAARGTELVVEAEGTDAETAVASLCDLIARGFES